MAECHIPFPGHCDLDLVFRIFDVGIPNLVCKCILGIRSVSISLFWVTVTLTSHPVSRIGIVWCISAYFLYYLRSESQIGV